jgi:hypothetical protein
MQQEQAPPGRSSGNTAPEGDGAAQPQRSGMERRTEQRRPVERITQLMRVCKLIFDGHAEEPQPCSVLDASDNGYRVALTSARDVELGTRVIFEHIDGMRKYVRVCWRSGNELGLKIDWTYARIILDAAESMFYDCKFLRAASNIYRVEVADPKTFSVGQQFVLESANGLRHAVRVRWIWENELGLQSV